MRPSERLPHRPDGPPTDRRSFLRTWAAIALGAQSGIAATVTHLSQPHREQHAAHAVRPRTKDDLIALLRQECGYGTVIAEEGPSSPPVTAADAPFPGGAAPPLPSVDPAAMGKRLASVSDRIAHCSSDELCSAIQWMRTYRISASDAQSMPSLALDCNDHCDGHCERLAYRYDMPMHLVAYWPADEGRTGHDDWHIVAACRIGTRAFLVLDNTVRATLWHGTLEEYGRDCPRRFPGWPSMSVIPLYGIARYVRPRFAQPGVGKLVLQLGNCRDEDAMEIMALEDAAPAHLAVVTPPSTVPGHGERAA